MKKKKMSQRTSVFFAAAAVVLTAFFVWYGQRPTTPESVTWQDVAAEAAAGGYRLISTEELAERYRTGSSNLLLVDTRQEWEYRTGHIRGALNFPMEPTWWSRWIEADDLEEFLGPDKDRTIVFY